MAHAGEVIDNPVTGEHGTWLKTASETNGTLSRIEWVLHPKGGVAVHVHMTYTETFTVRHGELTVMGAHGSKRIVHVGETVTIPIGTAHGTKNETTSPVTFVVDVEPARTFERSIETAFALARAGKTNKLGIPTNLFEFANIFILSESYLVGVPVWLHKAILGPIAALGCWLGYSKQYALDSSLTYQ